MDGGDGRVLSDSLPRPRDADGQIAGGRSTEGRNPCEDCSGFPGKGGRLVSTRRPRDGATTHDVASTPSIAGADRGRGDVPRTRRIGVRVYGPRAGAAAGRRR